MAQAGRVLTLIAALCIIATGLLAGSIGLVAGILDAGASRLAIATLSVSFAALTVGLGSILAWQAWRTLQGKPSRPFGPVRVGILIILFLAAIVAGQTVLSLELLPVLFFPPIHIVAASLPPLIVLALAGRALSGATRRRDTILQLSSGAFVSTTLAFSLEFVFIVGLLVGVAVLIALVPGGMEQIERLASMLQDPTWLEDPTQLAPIARSPAIVLGTLLVFAGIVPLIEEAVKTVGVGLRSYRHPNMAQAFLWGLAGGAGFALVEGVLNTAGGLDLWAPIVLLRVGATLLHCFTGALMGLAWYFALNGRRWGRALGLYAASVGIHGLWNALSALMAFTSLWSAGAETSGTVVAAGELALVAIPILLIAISIAIGLGLASLTRYVGERNTAEAPLLDQHAPGHEPVSEGPDVATEEA